MTKIDPKKRMAVFDLIGRKHFADIKKGCEITAGALNHPVLAAIVVTDGEIFSIQYCGASDMPEGHFDLLEQLLSLENILEGSLREVRENLANVQAKANEPLDDMIKRITKKK